MLVQNEMYAGLVDAYAATGMSGLVFNRFRKLAICSDMEAEACLDLFSCFEVEQIGVGEPIYETDAASDHFMQLILDGVVSISGFADPSAASDRRLESGDAFGPLSFPDTGDVRPTMLIAQSDVTLLSISREYFNLITVEYPALADQLRHFNRALAGRGVTPSIKH